MEDDFGLSRFEREVIRYLRALPFEVQQHVSRTILRLCKEHGTIPLDPHERPSLGDVGTPVWNITHDELRKLREEMGMGEGDEA